MNVVVSVFGRFHAFYLARELERRDYLESLITSYPKFSVTSWGVSRRYVRSLWPLEVARRAARLSPSFLKEALRLDEIFHRSYEHQAARMISSEVDLFVGWSGTAESGIRKSHDLQATSIVERCSSHIRTQRSILEEEFGRHGADPVLPSRKIVEKEEREYAAADYIAVPSSFVAQSFEEQGISSERLLQIPYGVDPGEFAPVRKEDDVFRAVYAGQLGHRKGIQYLLRAWKELDLPNSELLLLGPVRREFRPWMEQYEGYYRHAGSLPQRELYKWYSQGSVFVLPSVEEGMAYVQLQAMACGLPLICTPHTGGEDLIRDNMDGFVVPIRDVEALKNRLSWCFDHREACRMMGRSARQRILKQFTWRDYGNRVVRAYEQIVKGRDSDARW